MTSQTLSSGTKAKHTESVICNDVMFDLAVDLQDTVQCGYVVFHVIYTYNDIKWKLGHFGTN